MHVGGCIYHSYIYTRFVNIEDLHSEAEVDFAIEEEPSLGEPNSSGRAISMEITDPGPQLMERSVNVLLSNPLLVITMHISHCQNSVTGIIQYGSTFYELCTFNLHYGVYPKYMYNYVHY